VASPPRQANALSSQKPTSLNKALSISLPTSLLIHRRIVSDINAFLRAQRLNSSRYGDTGSPLFPKSYYRRARRRALITSQTPPSPGLRFYVPPLRRLRMTSSPHVHLHTHKYRLIHYRCPPVPIIHLSGMRNASFSIEMRLGMNRVYRNGPRWRFSHQLSRETLNDDSCNFIVYSNVAFTLKPGLLRCRVERLREDITSHK